MMAPQLNVIQTPNIGAVQNMVSAGEPMNIAFVTHALIFVLWISMEMFALTDDVVKNFL